MRACTCAARVIRNVIVGFLHRCQEANDIELDEGGGGGEEGEERVEKRKCTELIERGYFSLREEKTELNETKIEFHDDVGAPARRG